MQNQFARGVPTKNDVMAAKDRTIDAGTIDITLARWDAVGVVSTPDEALKILRVVAGLGT